MLDGDRAVKSCTMFAVQADGHEITTVEGLEQGGKLHPLQQAFWDQHGLQCGYCTPGMLMTCLRAAQTQSQAERSARSARASPGNLCRCTGYQNIVKAVQQAATGRSSGAGHDDDRDSSPTVTRSASAMKRKEDPRFIRGKGRYLDDIVLPHMLYLGAGAQSVSARAHHQDRQDRGARACPASRP